MSLRHWELRARPQRSWARVGARAVPRRRGSFERTPKARRVFEAAPPLPHVSYCLRHLRGVRVQRNLATSDPDHVRENVSVALVDWLPLATPGFTFKFDVRARARQAGTRRSDPPRARLAAHHNIGEAFPLLARSCSRRVVVPDAHDRDPRRPDSSRRSRTPRSRPRPCPPRRASFSAHRALHGLQHLGAPHSPHALSLITIALLLLRLSMTTPAGALGGSLELLASSP